MNSSVYTGNVRYIGIDDTDNLDTRGTGFRARQLVEYLQEKGLADGIAVTRHQLLVDDRVPYTSHNSSACIIVETETGVVDELIMNACREFLLEIAATGSDVGLCLANQDQACKASAFGERAKVALVQQHEAREIAELLDIRLEGLTGDHQGIIGSLSAVGLHAQGNDGRYIWPRTLDADKHTLLNATDIVARCGIDKITLINGEEVDNNLAQIQLGEWARAVRVDYQAVLLVEKLDVQHQYKILEKDLIKSVRP